MLPPIAEREPFGVDAVRDDYAMLHEIYAESLVCFLEHPSRWRHERHRSILAQECLNSRLHAAQQEYVSVEPPRDGPRRPKSDVGSARAPDRLHLYHMNEKKQERKNVGQGKSVSVHIIH